MLQTASSQTKNVTPSCATLIAVINSPAVSSRDKWSVYTWADGKPACSRVSGHEDWVFLKPVNTPSGYDFQAVERVGVSLCDPEATPAQQSEVHQSLLVVFLICAIHTP